MILTWAWSRRNTDDGRVSARIRGSASGLGAILVTVLGLAIVTFVIGRQMPIDPVLAIVGDQAPADVVERVRLELGLDKSLAEQFYIYVQHLVRGDLGTSIMTGRPVTVDILDYFPATLELATTAMVFAVLVGVPLGVFAAAWQGSRFDNVVRVVSLGGQSLPVFVLALICLVIFYVKFNVVPGSGRQGVGFLGAVPTRTGILVLDAAWDGQWDAVRDALAHLAMPSLILAFYTLSVIARMTRTFMLEALSGEFIVAARAKGLSEARIIWRHGFGNIAGRLVGVIVLAYAGLLEGAVLTETVFSWPGLGLYMTRSLLNADMNAVLGATLVVGLIYVCLNLLADVAQRLLDPRVQ